MNTRSGDAALPGDATKAEPLPAARAEDTRPVVEILKDHLMEQARARTIRRAVAGGRFCAVMLDDGGVGVANVCPEVCGEPSPRFSDWLPPVATPAADALEALSSPERSAVGLAVVNALANRSRRHHGQRGEASMEGDLLVALELRPEDHLGMVGCFSPLVEPIRRQVGRLSIFERGPRLAPGLLPEQRAFEILPECSVAVITATTLINGTIDALLVAAAHCREIILLGPSTPLLPEIFAGPPRRVTLLAGTVVTDPEELLRIVAADGGTRDFQASVVKVNVRLPTAS